MTTTEPVRVARASSAVRRVVGHSLFWPSAALVVLLLACGIVSPGFLDVTVQDGHLFGQLVDIARTAVPYLLLALGMCLVISTGGIDLSVGAVMAISLAVALTYLDSSPSAGTVGAALTALALGLAAGLVAGAFNGFMVSVLGIQPFVATIILMVAGRGIALLFTRGQITTTHSPPFKYIGSGFVLGVPMPIVLGAVVFVGVALMVRRTALGMMLEAIGINGRASRLSGVKAGAVIFIVYVASGVLAGLAGMVYGAPTMAADANNIGLMFEMYAIMVVVIGGTKLDGGKFYLGGLIVGAMIVATLERAVIIFHFPSSTKLVFNALVLAAVCLAASPSLRGRRARRFAARPPAASHEPVAQEVAA
jgi:ribose/xylose/arabinose/galactoside ABC-type transport system permease subunit